MSIPKDSNDTMGQQPDEREVSLGRHRAQCSICRHPNCQDIEEAWVDWTSPEKIAYDYQISKDSLYRHCHALHLFAKRRENRMRVYEKILERLDLTKLSGGTILAAAKEYDKYAASQESMPGEHTDTKALFQRMTREERASFLRDGTLPEWFSGPSDPKTGIDQGNVNEAQNPETHSVQ